MATSVLLCDGNANGDHYLSETLREGDRILVKGSTYLIQRWTQDPENGELVGIWEDQALADPPLSR